MRGQVSIRAGISQCVQQVDGWRRKREDEGRVGDEAEADDTYRYIAGRMESGNESENEWQKFQHVPVEKCLRHPSNGPSIYPELFDLPDPGPGAAALNHLYPSPALNDAPAASVTWTL
jgi:hypothetical protein